MTNCDREAFPGMAFNSAGNVCTGSESRIPASFTCSGDETVPSHRRSVRPLNPSVLIERKRSNGGDLADVSFGYLTLTGADDVGG